MTVIAVTQFLGVVCLFILHFFSDKASYLHISVHSASQSIVQLWNCVSFLNQVITERVLTFQQYYAQRSLNPLLISRFLLNLREVHERDVSLSHFSQLSTPAFRIPVSVTGTLGGQVGFDDDVIPGDAGEEQEERPHTANVLLRSNGSLREQHSIGETSSTVEAW